jgi:3',5'-cyclic AMP phosphodiesterase CpdA
LSPFVLHLSDIHAGPGALRDEDVKNGLPDAEGESYLERLSSYVRALRRRPDFVVVSGDLTLKGSREGLIEVRRWLDEHIASDHLPPHSRIVVVPGNHDVMRGEERAKDRFQAFHDSFGTQFTRAHVPELDAELDPDAVAIDTSADLIGGTTANWGTSPVVAPFVVDTKADVLVFAFNSALGCGVRTTGHNDITSRLSQLIGNRGADAGLVAELTTIQSAYSESLIIDAGLIGTKQLAYFGGVMQRLTDTLGHGYDRLTKIAVLHHHVSHLWDQQLELKSFESVVDAPQFKQALTQWSFDLVLHGHKHLNHVGIDASIIPIDKGQIYNPLCIVSGGTVGGEPRRSDSQSFKLIRLVGTSGPRKTATIVEVPLRGSTNPRAEIERSNRVFVAPIASRLPELHDLEQLKAKLDHYVMSKVAPEALPHGQQPIPARLELPVADRSLVNDLGRYTFYCSTTRENVRTFYDVILATKKIPFRDRARIYWLLSDALNQPGTNETTTRVVVVVANCELTHFGRAVGTGEVEESLQVIRDTFGPSIDRGVLEIRGYNLSQAEVDQFAVAANPTADW